METVDSKKNLSVVAFAEWAGIGPTLARELVAKRAVRSFRVGRRVLIAMEDALVWRDGLREKGGAA